ncbi:hypothetical protein [Puniceibacterium sediminis]|uniref:Uncharacterized protein n=1 Tax=Puniceibacterium sediminis TaxID=1608407 RepID=A0A238ZS54_9RHOB|nr:hypothetical protein [Puniceibacterium sediminis]SNR86247.1 hypothetical protein SAMN06265370_1401 [Puniceibacterium sediminis]
MTQNNYAPGQSISFRKTMTVAEQGFFTGISGSCAAEATTSISVQRLSPVRALSRR